jgi:GT2 family glycosyltransferase
MLWWEAAEEGHELSLEYAQGNRGVVEVRNMIMGAFLASDADVLLMVDDDVVPGAGVLELCKTAAGGRFAVVGAPCPIMRPGTTVLPNVYVWNERERRAAVAVELATRPGVQECHMVGFGCVALSRAVCQKLKYFKPRLEGRRWAMGEDLEFCLRARSQGFRVAANMDVQCEHMLRVHGNAAAYAYAGLMENLVESYEQKGGGDEGPEVVPAS